MTPRLLRAAVERSFLEDGSYTLSVWASETLDADGIARRVRDFDPGCQHLPHNQMQVATAARIRAVAQDVVLSEPPPGHHSIMFDARPSDTDLEALIGVFGVPQENPVPRSTT